jgi:CelD/BcsL family acetyltransferase involved in cellulose biosynthesis
VRTELYAGSPGELAPEWEEIYRADPGATPFVSPGWGLAWIRHWGEQTEPWLVTVRVDDRLVGLAALALERRRGTRVLRLVGKEPGDYWDVLALPEDRDAVTTAVAAELSRREEQWDVFFLAGQPGQCATAGLSGERSLRVRGREPMPCPRITLFGDFEEYLQRLPGSHRSNVRKHLRRLDAGQVTVRAVTDPSRLEGTIARWHELHLKRWAGLAQPIEPEHLTSRFREFVLDVMYALVPLELATVWEFVVEDEVVGVYLNLIDDESFYWYLGGFDPDRAKLGIGKMSVAHGIRWSIDTGRRYFDFTRGEESFKYYFGATNRHCPSVVVGNERLRSRSAFAASDLRDRLGRATRGARMRLGEGGSTRPRLGALARYWERAALGPR